MTLPNQLFRAFLPDTMLALPQPSITPENKTLNIKLIGITK